MRGGGWLGALLGADALCAANLVKLCSVRAPRAVSVRRAGECVCLSCGAGSSNSVLTWIASSSKCWGDPTHFAPG